MLTLSLLVIEDDTVLGLSTVFSCGDAPGSTFVMQSGGPVDSSAMQHGHIT